MAILRRRLAVDAADAAIASELASDAAFPPKEAKSQPLKKLPTDRIKFKSQLDIIRAYGVASQNGSRAVNYKDAAKLVKMDGNTVSLMSGFLVENGFVERSGNDSLPTKATVDFALAHGWSAETAPRKLAPLIRKSWFGTSLLQKLAFRAMPEDDAVAELANEIAAAPEYKARISMLIDYAEAAGLVRRDNGQLTLGEVATAGQDMTALKPDKPIAEAREDPPVMTRTTTGTMTATSFLTTEGAVQFHVSIRVSMNEIAGWSPDRITAFFNGLAQVLAAKKGTEDV